MHIKLLGRGRCRERGYLGPQPCAAGPNGLALKSVGGGAFATFVLEEAQPGAGEYMIRVSRGGATAQVPAGVLPLLCLVKCARQARSSAAVTNPAKLPTHGPAIPTSKHLLPGPALLSQSLGRAGPPFQACASYLASNSPSCTAAAVFMGSLAQRWKLVPAAGKRGIYIIRPAAKMQFCPWQVGASTGQGRQQRAASGEVAKLGWRLPGMPTPAP